MAVRGLKERSTQMAHHCDDTVSFASAFPTLRMSGSLMLDMKCAGHQTGSGFCVPRLI